MADYKSALSIVRYALRNIPEQRSKAVSSSSWANGQVSAQPVSWYLLRDDAVRVNILGHTGNYRDFYSAMAGYDDGVGGSLAADALDSLFMKADDGLDKFHIFTDELLNPELVSETAQSGALGKLCAEEELTPELMGRLGLDYNPEECAVNVTNLQSYIAHNGTAELADTWYDLGRELPGDFFNYLQALATDAELMANETYTGDEGSLLPSLQKALTEYCPPVRLGGFMDQWESGAKMMYSTNSLQALLADVYHDDPSALMQSYVSNQGNNNSIVNALAAIPYLTPSSLINAGELHLSWYHSVTLYQQILKYQRIYLASHVIYGSCSLSGVEGSRLGTKDYLPGQLYSLVDYQQAQPVIDTSILNGRRPWYSGQFNDDIEPGATTVWGNTQTGPFLVSERIGEKQYELSNHTSASLSTGLGNVQATVSDNRYEVADKHTDSIIARHPALRSAYDYYPFGMLMPGRYVSDTSQHCVTVTRPTWVWKEVTVACWDVLAWVWPGYTRTGEGTAVVDGDAVRINAPGASDAVSFDFSVTPNVQQTLTLDIERINLNDKAYVEVMEQQGEGWVTLAETPVDVVSGGLQIPFKPSGSQIRVVWHGRILVWVRHDCISKLEWVEEDQLVTICDGDKDKYRFGFNGQEKVNEWSGIGNFNEFKERGQDTRIGRFLSIDPIASKYPWNSSYAFAENRVIDGVDLEGREFRKAPGMFTSSGKYLGKNTVVKKPSAYLIYNLRTNLMPDYYKLVGVQDMHDLINSAMSTQQKQFQLNPAPAEGAATSTRQAREGLAGMLLNTFVEGSQEVKALEEVRNQARQFDNSIILVAQAEKLGLIPKQFTKDNKFKSDLVNFVFDGTKAFGLGDKGEAYNKIISTLGREIYSNRSAILRGKYERANESNELVPNNWGLDQPGPPPMIIKHYGKDELDDAVKHYNNAQSGYTNCKSLNSKK